MHEKGESKLASGAGVPYEPKEFRAQTKNQAERALRVQAKIFDNFESMTRSWIHRRRAASEQALSTVARMCDCDNPAEANAIYNEWLTGSIDRMIADSRTINEQSMQVFQQMMEQVVGDGAEKSDGGEKSPKSHDVARKEAAETKTADKPMRSAQRSAG